ncbi:MAG: hypothetical protein A3F68_01990 [Acidobacteria bacterium RIFCSPLOWO2_12_FULL_54_10]|nr:MAG: hypothetical protein A3F68_01990 [Acidobacteria bacterium RIFCSPLOWO2_12_FULL_54_10]
MGRKKRSNEQGYILLTLLLAAAVIVIGFSRILPSLVQQSKRQKEMELIYRGKQYQRGIQLFVRKFGRYPNNLEELEKTNEMRFIRKRYEDPLTESGEWRLIHIAPDGSFPDSITLGQGGGPAGETGLKVSEGMFGQREETEEEEEESQEPATRATSGTGQNPQQPRATGAEQEQKQNPVIGGGGIAGVASLDTEDSVIVWNKFRQHDQWEFIYDFRQDPLGLQAVQNLFGGGAQPPGAPPGQPPQGGRNPNQPLGTQPPIQPPPFGSTPGIGGGPGRIGGGPGSIGSGGQGGFAPTPIPGTTPQQRRP